jgi:ATPase family associated with various cellular activities (AAA)
MADLNRLTNLFQAIAARDWNAAEAIAREVVTGEDRIGHHAAAQRLRGALHPNGRASDTYAVAGNSDTGNVGGPVQFLTSALSLVAAEKPLSDIRLRSRAQAELQDIIKEWGRREELVRRGLARRTKLLFHGPPGCGKSVAARAIAHELGLPVYVVRFDAVVGAYLGQTALHLRQLFRFAESTPSVVLVDEIDALGKRRGNPLDVGELDRVVIALLQELEHSHPAGLLIATSNLARQLDEALWRRFDLVVDFPAPSKSEVVSFGADRAKARGVNVTPALRASIARAKSYADAERRIEAEERRLVLKS